MRKPTGLGGLQEHRDSMAPATALLKLCRPASRGWQLTRWAARVTKQALVQRQQKERPRGYASKQRLRQPIRSCLPASGTAHDCPLSVAWQRSANKPDSCNRDPTPSAILMWQKPMSCRGVGGSIPVKQCAAGAQPSSKLVPICPSISMSVQALHVQLKVTKAAARCRITPG